MFAQLCIGRIAQQLWTDVSEVLWLVCLWDVEPRAGSGVVRIDLLRFLAGCRTSRLNQV